MKFKELNRLNGFEVKSEKEFSTLEGATNFVDTLFKVHDVWCFEEIKYANGIRSLSLKDRSNKIVYQLKTESE